MEKYTEVVNGVECEIKIRDYLKKRLGLSTSLIGKVKYDNVKLNGEYVHMRAMVKNGDIIEITLPDEESENVEPIELDLDIVYFSILLYLLICNTLIAILKMDDSTILKSVF